MVLQFCFHALIHLDGYEFELFYLTSDGENVSNCGKTVETACKTLRQILSIYYNTSGIPQHGLEIITSKSSIAINKELMVSRMTCVILIRVNIHFREAQMTSGVCMPVL